MPKIGSLRAKKTANQRRIKANIGKMKALQAKESKLAKKAAKHEAQIKRIEKQWASHESQVNKLKEKNWAIDALIQKQKK